MHTKKLKMIFRCLDMTGGKSEYIKQKVRECVCGAVLHKGFSEKCPPDKSPKCVYGSIVN